MSQDMSTTITELRHAAAVISEAADRLAEQTSEATPAATPAEPPLTLEAVRAVLAEKSRTGFTTQIRTLLEKYGADRLSAVEPANYKALLADVKELHDAG